MSWGENENGQIGDGTFTGPEQCRPVGYEYNIACAKTPVAVVNLSKEVASVAAGSPFSLALLKNGTVSAWGHNFEGELGDGTTSGPETCVPEDGSARPCSDVPVAVLGLSEVSTVAANGQHTLALLKNGRVKTWGGNFTGELGIGIAGEPSDVPVEPCAALEAFPCARHLEGIAVVGAGDNEGYVSAGPSSAPAPTVTQVSPSHGNGAGGTTVTITGTHFTGATAVKFGTSAAEHFTVTSETAITAISPPGTAMVDVTVLTAAGTSATSTADHFTYGAAPAVEAIVPSSGPTTGGTPVKITGSDFLSGATVTIAGRPLTEVVATGNELTGRTPPGIAGKAEVVVSDEYGSSTASGTPNPFFVYVTPIERAEYKGWILAGSITSKALGQAITLPAGSTFNGSGEVNLETGTGSVGGNISIPPFTASLKLFSLLPASLGITVSPVGALAGTVADSETTHGDETLTVPLKLKLSITSVGMLGLTIPTKCTTREPVSLSLTDTLTREELLDQGWSFAGTTTLPPINCVGGLLGASFGEVLSVLLSGPENPYTLSIKAP
jgi:hypothetical protein